MRETQILRGLHKARAKANDFADGMVPEPPATSFRGIGNAIGRWMTRNPALDKPAPAPVVEAPAAAPAQPKAISGYAGNNALQKRMAAAGLSRGVAKLHGPGTTTSDSIPANLSRGEAVLPAKTVKAVGAGNLARLIHQTNGKPPMRGLKAGMHASGGDVPLPEYDILPENKRAAKPAATAPLPGAEGIDFNSVKPPQTPTDTSLGGRAKSIWGAAKGLFSGSPEAAPAAPKAPLTASQRAQAYNPKFSVGMPGAEFIQGAAETGSKWVKRGGKVLAPAAAALDASDVLDVATDKNMGGLDVGTEIASKAGKWGSAGAGAAAGGALGTVLGGGILSPVTGPLGALAGGTAGYFGGDAAIKGLRGMAGLDTRDPSQHSNGIVSKAFGQNRDGAASPVAAQSAAPAPYDPNQTAATRERAPFTAGTAGAGRGSLMPPGTVLDNGKTAPSDPRSRDFSAELNAHPAQLPSDLREGVVHKTVDAQGRVTYSGRNVAPGADGSTQMVDGLGKSMAMRGSMDMAAAGAPVAMGGGGFAITPSGLSAGQSAQPQGAQSVARPAMGGMSAGQTGVGGTSAVSAALQAAMARGDTDAVKGFYQRDGGTFNGRTAEQDNPTSPDGVLMAQINKSVARNGGLTSRAAQALVSMNNTDKNYKSSMYGHEISRTNSREGHEVQARGDDLQYQGTQNRLGLDRAKMSHEIGQAAAKGVSDDAMLSPFATVVDEKTGERKVTEAAANDLRQFRRASAGRIQTPDGKPINLEQLRSTNPPEYQRQITAIDSAYGMGQPVNRYAKDKIFGAQTGWGAPKISNVREMGPGDWFKGAGLTDALIAGGKPGYYSQGVEIDLGGRKQIVPIGEFLSDQNGGQFRETLNNWLVANKRARLGNMATGE